MALSSAQIRPGIVAYLDAAALNADAAVVKPVSPTTRNGPFLCFARSGQMSGWAPISTQHRDERLLISQEWRVSGGGSWQQDDQYLNDGSTTYVGPNASFIAAATATDKFDAATRPRVLPAGVTAVVGEIQARGGKVP